ncbi:MAG: hypothetical protein NVSMB14_10190 [Isosphaeraceae bacterium]
MIVPEEVDDCLNARVFTCEIRNAEIGLHDILLYQKKLFHRFHIRLDRFID